MMLKRVRWGRVPELAHVRKIFSGQLRTGRQHALLLTPAFRKLPLRLRHLSAWRRMHALATHRVISALAPTRPSSNMSLKAKLWSVAAKGG